MTTVDEIVRDSQNQSPTEGADSEITLARFDRKPHVAVVRQLSQVSGVRTTLYLLLHWGLIIASFLAAALTRDWGWAHAVVVLFGALLICSRMQALGVMLHDATHYLLYKNRTLNDVVSDLLIAFPLGMSTTLYRRTHFRHHRFTNTEQDQDLAAMREEAEWYRWPKTKLACCWTVVRTILGLNTHRSWILLKHWAPWYHLFDPVTPDFPLRARVLYILSTVTIYGAFFWGLRVNPALAVTLVAMYIVSGFTLLNLINRLRATAEHLGVPGTHELNSTRTVIPHPIERFFIAPHGVNFHLEHHLFPSVPGYNLSKLHRHLMTDPQFSSLAHVTRSYVGLVAELMRLKAGTLK